MEITRTPEEEELRRDILAAKEQLERGEGKVYDSADQLLEDIVTEGTKRNSARAV